MRFKFNPFSGQLDVVENIKRIIEAANRLETSFIAGENFSALKFIRINNSQEAVLANNSDFISSKTVGISLGVGIEGENVPCLLFGQIEDPLFNYPANTVLFLGSSGSLTDVVPTSGTVTRLGQSLGPGSIFIKIEEPIQL